MWFLRAPKPASECESGIASLVEREITSDDDDNDSGGDSHDDSGDSESHTDSSSGESGSESSSEESSDGEESSDDESSSSGGSSSDESIDEELRASLGLKDLRDDIDAAHYEIGVWRDRVMKRLDEIETEIRADREERARASSAAAIATANAAAAASSLATQSALRSELSRAAWDEIDREFAVEARRFFIGFLRASEGSLNDTDTLKALVDSMALTQRTS